LFCFFFSSRRRHTRCLSDWSSDVCSSDLLLVDSADDDDGKLRPPARSAGSRPELEPVQLREHQIQDHRREWLTGGGGLRAKLLGFLRRRGGARRESDLGRDAREQPRGALLILDDEDRQRHLPYLQVEGQGRPQRVGIAEQRERPQRSGAKAEWNRLERSGAGEGCEIDADGFLIVDLHLFVCGEAGASLGLGEGLLEAAEPVY